MYYGSTCNKVVEMVHAEKKRVKKVKLKDSEFLDTFLLCIRQALHLCIEHALTEIRIRDFIRITNILELSCRFRKIELKMLEPPPGKTPLWLGCPPS